MSFSIHLIVPLQHNSDPFCSNINPLFKCGGGLLYGSPTPATPKRKIWTANLMLEDRSGEYPHVILGTCHDCNLESPDTILLGELGGIVTIIRNRMRQEGLIKAPFPVGEISLLFDVVNNPT